MAQVLANPESIRRFAQQLKAFNNEVSNQRSIIIGAFANLGDTWHDQEHQRFAEEFQQLMRALEQFRRMSEAHIPLLLRKAERLQEYLDTR